MIRCPVSVCREEGKEGILRNSGLRSGPTISYSESLGTGEHPCIILLPPYMTLLCYQTIFEGSTKIVRRRPNINLGDENHLCPFHGTLTGTQV